MTTFSKNSKIEYEQKLPIKTFVKEGEVVEDRLLLDCKDIYKSFGDNHVLKGINLSLSKGEVSAIIGGNGAGKSTLMKIIMGIYKADRGEINVQGSHYKSITPAMALANGIYLVPQEPMLFKNMTVLENILLGLPGNKNELKAKLKEIIDELKWTINLERKADTLTIAEQQLVEILKGLIREAKILILDEPTSSLTFNETKSLFILIEKLKSEGVGIIYITHRLTEVFEIATDIIIMRDGKISLSGKTSEFTNDMLIQALLPDGASVDAVRHNKSYGIDRTCTEPVFKVEHFTGNGFKNVSFDVYPGEILGLAGVVGAGRTELAETIFGKDEVHEGRVFLGTMDIIGKSTNEVIHLGLNYVPEDRFKNGIFKISDIGMNISASALQSVGKYFVDRNREKELYDYFKRSFNIKTMDMSDEIGSLSGGNQQKVVIAKSIASMPKLLILDEPTRGIDAGARGDVYRIIQELKSRGLAILMISSDMEEVVQLSDRAVTMYHGKLNAEFIGDDINQENLMSASFGVVKEANVS